MNPSTIPRPATPPSSRPTLWKAASFILAAAAVIQIAVSSWRLLMPVEIGGGPFGGYFDGLARLTQWGLPMACILLGALVQLPGFSLAWIAAGGLALSMGALALWQYPPAGAGLVFSPLPSEIGVCMALGGAAIVLGLVWIRRVGPLAFPGLGWLRGAAMAGAAVLCIYVPLARQLQSPLPPCAFDKAGRQLSVCLSTPHERHTVIS
jgi:hypothetical protein